MSTERENSGSQMRPDVPGDAAARNVLVAALPGRPDQNQHAHFSARVIFRALGRRWRLALGLGVLLGTGAALAMVFGRPVTYTSYALLEVSSTENKILPTTGGDDSSKTYQKTQVALIKSRSMLLAALRDNKARKVSFLQNVPDPAAWLEGELQVGFIEGTDLLRIALTEANPQEIAEVVNAVKKVYLEENTKKERSDKLTHLSELENLCSKMDEKILHQRENVRKLGQILQTSDPAALTLKQKQALEEWGTLRKELQGLQKKKRDLGTRVFIEMQRIKAAESAPVPATQIDNELERDPKLKEAFTSKETLERKLKTDYDEGSPKYLDQKKKLEEAKTKYDQLRAAKQKELIETARKPLVQKLLAALADTEEELAVTTKQEEAVDQGVRELSQIAGNIGTTSLEL
ncbi:MAG TPA: Wzz/FepE/Etk N-terminal domain-containing protein, partial [Gemmataceae bacterium]|nr:Wzz/FepE/Etk N-terminal domain-containing protein [Gemmataceae bacterium]